MAYTKDEFVKKYSPYINSIVKDTGLLTGTVISQAIVESSGNYNTGGKWLVGGSQLSQEANNWFGIKADSGWNGKVYNIKTAEYDKSGKKYYINAPFRKYDSVEDSIKDHLSFLLKNSRYKDAGVFNAKTVAEQTKALQKAGYATAPNYASTLLDIYNSVKGYISSGIEVAKKGITSAKTYTEKHYIIVGLSIIALGFGVYFIIKSQKKQ